MTTLHRVRTEWVNRYHVEIDADASVLDCFTVELPTVTLAPMLVQGDDMNAMWLEARAMLASLRAQPRVEVRGAPRDVFEPFGIITAHSLDDVRREHEVRMNVMLGSLSGLEQIARMAQTSEADAQTMHERGVQHLCRAHDLLRGAPLAVPVPWPKLKALMN